MYRRFLFFYYFMAHNNVMMIYFVGLICGIINGLFASLAGQIMVFYLAFILKKESHISRGSSICAMSIVTIISLIVYSKFLKFDILTVLIVGTSGLIFGFFGAKIMNKIESRWLNLISGILLTGLSVYKIIF